MRLITPAAPQLLAVLLAALLAFAGCAARPEPPREADPPAAANQPPGAGTSEDLAEPLAATTTPVEGAVAADLDGDGQAEWVRGLSDTWTTDPVEIYDADGQLLYTWGQYALARKLAYRTSVHTLPDLSRTVLLSWQRLDDGRPEVGILAFTREEGEFRPVGFYGWGLKHANSTLASRAYFSDDGHLVVEWDMGDPARHTRVRKYALHLAQRRVEIVEERLVPEGDDLVYPTEPEEVLRAAHLAAVYGLDEELPRYFASADVARAFQAAMPDADMPDGRLDWTRVELAAVHALNEYCVPESEPAHPDASGAAPFLVAVVGEIYVDATVGTVWFDSDEAGRTVIRDFEVLNRCSGP